MADPRSPESPYLGPVACSLPACRLMGVLCLAQEHSQWSRAALSQEGEEAQPSTPTAWAHVYLMMSIIPVLSLERSEQLMATGNSPQSWAVDPLHVPAWPKSSTPPYSCRACALYLQRYNCCEGLPCTLDSQLYSSKCFCSFPRRNGVAVLREHS